MRYSNSLKRWSPSLIGTFQSQLSYIRLLSSTSASVSAAASSPASTSSSPSSKIHDNLTLQDFIQSNHNIKLINKKSKNILINNEQIQLNSLKFYIETYGCQMNISDSEIIRSVLLDAGHIQSDNLEAADIILANTCAIRENAEAKVWHRLHYFKSIKNKNKIGKFKPGKKLFL